jgi:hypothetical protein
MVADFLWTLARGRVVICYCGLLSLNLEHGESGGVRHYRAWLGLGTGEGLSVYGQGTAGGIALGLILLAILYARDVCLELAT